jgi:hypothetical protein
MLAVIAQVSFAGCGNDVALGTVNPSFPDLSESSTPPKGSINPDDTEQVTVVEPGPPDQAGKIGTIADRDPSHVLCVLIDPAEGEDANLEVCDANRVNTETESASGLCPDVEAEDACASNKTGSEPDFCEVTGATDYAFVLINPTSRAVSVAYQVVDVTGYPNKSCGDLNITEDSIRADDY